MLRKGEVLNIPDGWWLVEPEFQEQYAIKVAQGEAVAKNSSICLLSIARNSMPYIENTLKIVDSLSARFKRFTYYVFENDSTDGTDAVLRRFGATRPWFVLESSHLGRLDYRGFESDRTIALAEYRNRCRHFASSIPRADYVAVLDTDPQGGFSPDGLMNSIGWIEDYAHSNFMPMPAGMASNSLWISPVAGDNPDTYSIASYDAWAARLNWWDDRRMHRWFHELILPVGAEPIAMNSAFGGLAVYTGEAFFSSGVAYAGGDCEHVAIHKSMKRAGYQMYLNPGCRYVAVMPDGIKTAD